MSLSNFKEILEKHPKTQAKVDFVELLEKFETKVSPALEKMEKATKHEQENCTHLNKKPIFKENKCYNKKGIGSDCIKEHFIGEKCSCMKFFPGNDGDKYTVCFSCGGKMRQASVKLRLKSPPISISVYICDSCRLTEIQNY